MSKKTKKPVQNNSKTTNLFVERFKQRLHTAKTPLSTEKHIKTRYGYIEGYQKNNMTQFKGIPYAKAPLGRLRFRAPKEPDSWEGVLETKTLAPEAIQAESNALDDLIDAGQKRT